MQQLRIGILDFTGLYPKSQTLGGIKSPSGTPMLREAIKARGHIPVLYKVEKCQMYYHGRKSEILYQNKKIKSCDVLIPRVSVNLNVDLEISIIKQFQMMGVPVLNEYLPVARAKNKLRTLQILTRYNVPVPRTLVVRKLEYIDEAIKRVSGYPVILKTPFGTWGSGVVIVESRRSLYSALDIIWRNLATNIILIQEYVAEAGGSDYRAFVLGDKVVASMKRTARTGDFRSNLHLGGEGEKVKLTEEEQRLAVRATQALGLKIGGVDILRSNRGPLIMEVNAQPGIPGITRVTGVDVAAEIVKYAESVVHKKNGKHASR